MTTFLQLHLLTAYPPACLNRDDLNRPKTAVMVGVSRLRVSSQSLKRAWRTSEEFEAALKDHMGTRTKLKGVHVYERLTGAGVREKDAKEWAQAIAARFGKLKGKKEDKPLNDLEIEQLAHFSPEEEAAINALADKLATEGRKPNDNELELLRKQHTAADIALFGRMLADTPAYNTEAACQVAHAITVHRAAVEDDFFTAVDDLNTREEDAGSAHMGEQGFGAGLFYSYICVNCDALSEQLGADLASKAIRALTEAAAKVAPTGKQNSFASRAWAYYALAEKGDRQPRALSLAFMKPANDYGDGMLANAVQALEAMRDNLDQVYYEGRSLASRKLVALPERAEGSFNELLDFCGGQ